MLAMTQMKLLICACIPIALSFIFGCATVPGTVLDCLMLRGGYNKMDTVKGAVVAWLGLVSCSIVLSWAVNLT